MFDGSKLQGCDGVLSTGKVPVFNVENLPNNFNTFYHRFNRRKDRP